MSKRTREDKEREASSSKRINNSAGIKGEDRTLLAINEAFKFHDLNNDGVISRADLLVYFKSDKTVAHILERIDKNNDGEISYSGTLLSTSQQAYLF